MLDDDIVLRNTYYWAKKLCCKQVEFNELVSIGYVVGKPLKDAKLLKHWIHFTMLHHVMDTIKNSQKHLEFRDEMGVRYYTHQSHDYSELYKHISKANLSQNQMRVITLIFVESLKQVEAGNILGVEQQTIHRHLKRAIAKIKKTYGYTDKCIVINDE